MEKVCAKLSIAVLLLLCIGLSHCQYKKKGAFTIGGIIPQTRDCSPNSAVDPAGVAIMESIDYALSVIEKDNGEFSKLKVAFGYDVKDSCNSADRQKEIAYSYSITKAKSPVGVATVDVVLAPFGKDSLKTLKVLSIENIPQISYAAGNARLVQDKSIPDSDIKLLASVFPNQDNKVLAVADYLEFWNFEHAYLVGSNDAHGRSGLKLLKETLNAKGICSSDPIYHDASSGVSKVLDTISKNPRIRIVVLHCSGEMETKIFEEAEKRNMTDLLFVSTHDWKMKEDKLRKYAEVVDGMVFVNTVAELSTNYKQHIKKLEPPYNGWLEKLFLQHGGDTKICYDKKLSTIVNNKTKHCHDARGAMEDDLLREKDKAKYAIDAVYAIAHAVFKQGNSSFLKSLTKQNFRSSITQNKVNFKDSMSVQSYSFSFHSVRGNTNFTMKVKHLKGEWRDEKNGFELSKRGMRWKGGSKIVPTSMCSDACPMGSVRVYPNGESCCWSCQKCPNGTVSNVTNAKECYRCPLGLTPEPGQKECVPYKKHYFNWFNAMGQFMIFLMVFGLCITLFSLGIYSQNSEHPVMKASGYKIMCFYLIGCAACFLAPIPLLMEPSVKTCSSYIGIFNVALTIPLAVMISKSAKITENYFDDEGDLIKGTLGSRPRALVILIVLCLQLGIVIAGLFLDPPKTLHMDTDQWDEKFAECSTYISLPFWAAFTYNMVISIICHFLSCSSTKVEANFSELKHIVCCLLWFHLGCIMEISLIYAEKNQRLAQAQAVMCIVFGFFFILNFAVPKVYIILFKTKADGTVEDDASQSLLEDGEKDPKVTATSHSDGFKHHGIVQMRIKEEVEEDA